MTSLSHQCDYLEKYLLFIFDTACGKHCTGLLSGVTGLSVCDVSIQHPRGSLMLRALVPWLQNFISEDRNGLESKRFAKYDV